MSKFKKNFRKLGGWDIQNKTHLINNYKQRVTDDPILKREYTAIDIERRIRSAANRVDPDEAIELDGVTVAYKTQFTKKGSFYYHLARVGQKPKAIVSIWTEEIYQNYLAGITSKGLSIYGSRR